MLFQFKTWVKIRTQKKKKKNPMVRRQSVPMFSKVTGKDVLRIMGLCFRPSKILGTFHLAF